MSLPPQRQLSHRQARQLMDTAYLAAATARLWVALYYLPVGSPLFRLALPLPLALLQLRHGWRCALEGLVVLSLLVVALMGPIRGPLVLFPYGFLALWLGWSWRRRQRRYCTGRRRTWGNGREFGLRLAHGIRRWRRWFATGWDRRRWRRRWHRRRRKSVGFRPSFCRRRGDRWPRKRGRK